MKQGCLLLFGMKIYLAFSANQCIDYPCNMLKIFNKLKKLKSNVLKDMMAPVFNAKYLKHL